jgi:ferredoxin
MSRLKRYSNITMEDKMKVSVDKELCMGDRNCNMLCPEVFKYDEDELMSIVLLDEIPEHLEDKVNQAVDECPGGAITID